MISQEEIKQFLEGADPEEFITSIEFDYQSDYIYKIKEIPYELINSKMTNKHIKFTTAIECDFLKLYMFIYCCF